MNSIDNLREYVLTAPSICSTTRAILVGYIDGIEREVDDMWHALTIDAKPMTDENMAESGWVRLPVDADGEPIHVGDVMDEGKVAKVVLTDEHWEPSVYVYKLPNVQHEYFCSEVTHHHAPTVEDVLREFAAQVTNGQHIHGAIEIEQAIAGCAAKLRLAGEDA